MPIKYYHDMKQGSDAWFDARLGIVTASNINLILTPNGKPANNDKMRKYAYELVAQRETWRVENTYQSFDMERGKIQEDLARNIYSESYAEVKECGFILNTELGFKLGASPDGLVGENGGIEIKSRLSKFQIQTVCENEVPQEYMNQIQACLLASGRDWWDFVQYSNGMPMFVKRVLPDEQTFENIITAGLAFEEKCKEIRAKYNENVSGLVIADYVEIMMDDEIEESEA